MSDEKIDVLAVMDRLIGNTRMVAGMTGDPAVRAHLLEGEQARAAVAELIEAATDAHDFAVNVARNNGEELDRRFYRLRAAILNMSS